MQQYPQEKLFLEQYQSDRIFSSFEVDIQYFKQKLENNKGNLLIQEKKTKFLADKKCKI